MSGHVSLCPSCGEELYTNHKCAERSEVVSAPPLYCRGCGKQITPSSIDDKQLCTFCRDAQSVDGGARPDPIECPQCGSDDKAVKRCGCGCKCLPAIRNATPCTHVWHGATDGGARELDDIALPTLTEGDAEKFLLSKVQAGAFRGNLNIGGSYSFSWKQVRELLAEFGVDRRKR
jgi:hypothetical protein